MKEELRRLFPNAVAVGEGLAARDSPFATVCETEYYDGPAAGFAFFTEQEAVATFKVIWWDEGQDNRLFELHVVEFEPLAKASDSLSDLVARAKRERWTSVPTGERVLAAQLFDVAARFGHAHLVALARDVAGPLFVLPAAGNEE